jgi:hypothetical protein
MATVDSFYFYVGARTEDLHTIYFYLFYFRSFEQVVEKLVIKMRTNWFRKPRLSTICSAVIYLHQCAAQQFLSISPLFVINISIICLKYYFFKCVY